MGEGIRWLADREWLPVCCLRGGGGAAQVVASGLPVLTDGGDLGYWGAGAQPPSAR